MGTNRTLRIAVMLAALAVGWTPPWRLDAQERRGIELITIVDATGRQVGLYEASYALVIGIADYTAGWPDLPGVRGDVEAVSRVLEEHGFEVRREMDLDHAKLETVIREFIAEKGQVEDARVLIYFAGHGHTLKQSFGGAMGYVVPADAPRPDLDRQGFVARALPMDQVEVYAKTIQAKHALFLFDSCFSGSIFALERAVPEHINAKTALPVRQFITSGNADETVPDESVFRRQLVAALEGEGDVNGDGYVTAAELGELLFEKVVNYSRGTQHPQYGKIRDSRLDKGDFVFRLPVPGVPTVPVVGGPSDLHFPVDANRRSEGKAVFMAQECQLCHGVPEARIEAITRSDKLKGPDLGSSLNMDLKEFAAYMRKEIAIRGRLHTKPFRGTDRELRTIHDWLGSL